MSRTTRSKRKTRQPELFMHEKYEKSTPYDRCMGGYKFVPVHKDHNYHQPKRDYTESIQESKLVSSIRNERKLNAHGYVDDGFVVSDDSIEFLETDDEISELDESDYEAESNEEDSSEEETDDEDEDYEESDESTDEE